MLLCFFSLVFAKAPKEELIKARYALENGDIETTIVITKDLLNQKRVHGTTKDATNYLLASAYQQQSAYLLAADYYYAAYKSGRALRKEALFARAQNLLHGKDYKKAINSCSLFRKNWPNDIHADECLLLMGESNGELGNISNMKYFYGQYLSLYPESPKSESIRVQDNIFTYKKNPDLAREKLRYLYFNHSYPSSVTQIESVLSAEELRAQTWNEESQWIWSRIRSGFLEEAWEKTQQLQLRQDEPAIKGWLDENLINITWYTRSYDEYIVLRKKAYRRSPSGLLAWKIFHAYTRAAKWEEAASWGDKMLKKYRGRGRWAGAKDNVARAHMFNRNYKRAGQLWEQQKGHLATFNYAFCTYMNGEYKTAIARFKKLSDRDDAWGVASNYWIGRSKEKMGIDPKEHFAFVRKHDHVQWYTLLLDQREDLPNEKTMIFNGQWKQRTLEQSQPFEKKFARELLAVATPKKYISFPDYHSNFSWEVANDPPKEERKVETTVTSTKEPQKRYSAHPFAGSALPNSYTKNPLYSDKQLDSIFAELAYNKGKKFPILQEIYALTLAGDYPIASVKLNIFYNAWKEAKKTKSRSKRKAKKSSKSAHYTNARKRLSKKGMEDDKPRFDPSIEDLFSSQREWLPYMLFVRSHHHVMRMTLLNALAEDSSPDMKRLNYPIVHPHYVWSLGHEYNIDPLLIHSILRAESVYQEFIVSWAGAIGYVQVMPKTGAKVAHLLQEESYSPEDLEHPKTNLRYGSFYLSRLMERFDQSYPFAVGSYNGGPHNMSRWYKNLKDNVDMDEFVEHVAFDETRRYIKKVCGYYHRYISYHHINSVVHMPLVPGEDDASVIDF